MTVPLSEPALPAVLRMLGEARASGLLTIAAESRFASLVLVDGQLLFAICDSTPRLDEALVEKGVLSGETMETVWQFLRRKKVHEPLGKVLRDLGLVSEELLEAEIESQITSVLRDLLGWTNGTMHFDPVDLRTDGLAFGDCLQVGIPLAELSAR